MSDPRTALLQSLRISARTAPHLLHIKCDEHLEDDDERQQWAEVQPNKEKCLIVDDVQRVACDVEFRNSNLLPHRPATTPGSATCLTGAASVFSSNNNNRGSRQQNSLLQLSRTENVA